MQNWSKQTKQYLLITLIVLVLAGVSMLTLLLQNKSGYALPDVLYVMDENGTLHEPKSAKSTQAIRNLRSAGIDTLKKEYPSVVLLDKQSLDDSSQPHLILNHKPRDIQQLIAQHSQTP